MPGAPDLFAALRAGSPRAALRQDGTTLCYGDLFTRAQAHAAAFRSHGLQPGERVVALAEPSLELVAAMLGAHWAGLVWVPLNPRYRPPEVVHVLEDCAPRLLLVDAGALAAVPTAPSCPVEALDPCPGLPLWRDRCPAAADVPATLLPDDATSLLVYTSGTTGRSKGVQHSHRSIATGIGALTRLWAWSQDDVLSLMLPLFHVHGLGIGIHGALMHGMEVSLHRHFDASTVVADVERGATIFMGVPTMYNRLLAHLEVHPADGPRLAQARLFTAGSAALPAEVLARFEAFTGHRILERYGMTETLLTISNPLRGERRPGSVGHPIEGVELRIVDDAGDPVQDDDPGELLVRCEGMMLGYWGNPEATAAAFDAEGWFRTGDVATRDAQGYVHIVGRSSVDIIKSGGFKIGAREIEDVLLTHPELEEVAVFGLPDLEWGERVVAAIVPRPGAPSRDAEAWLASLRAWASASLTGYKRPRQVFVLDVLPRNSLGKPQKALLKQRFAASP